MKSLFVDSFFFFAILNPKDAAYSKAIEFSKQHTGPLLTTSWVFTEVADGLAQFHEARRLQAACFQLPPGHHKSDCRDHGETPH